MIDGSKIFLKVTRLSAYRWVDPTIAISFPLSWKDWKLKSHLTFTFFINYFIAIHTDAFKISWSVSALSVCLNTNHQAVQCCHSTFINVCNRKAQVPSHFFNKTLHTFTCPRSILKLVSIVATAHERSYGISTNLVTRAKSITFIDVWKKKWKISACCLLDHIPPSQSVVLSAANSNPTGQKH